MASTIVSSTGLGSGLAIGDIVSSLVKADTSAKQSQITRQTSNNTAMLSGIGSLRSALTTFQSAMDKLNTTTAPSFNAFAATSANENVLKVTSSNTAVAGTYSVEVKNLATSSKVGSQLFAGGASSSVAQGALTITQNGKSYSLNVADGSTLQSVRDQINKELGASGFSANIISSSDGARLVLGSTTTGAGSDISVSGIDALAIDGTQSLTDNGAGYISGKAQDASVAIDGLLVSSASNTVKDAISGITLDLVAASAKDTPTKVTVAANNDGLKTSVQAFVDAFNTLQKGISSLTSTSKDSDGNTVLGSLTNDPTTRSLLNDIRGVLATAGSGDQLTTLSQLGVSTQKDGTLGFNTTTFTTAMNDKKLGQSVESFFTGTDGLFARMKKAITPYNATDGSLAARKSNLDKVAKNLTEQQEALDRRTTSLTESLTKQYVALDTALGKMKAQATQITSIFEAINAQAKNS
ncbi:flagellar filament capping protein FliD [Pseudomonas monteilii]